MPRDLPVSNGRLLVMFEARCPGVAKRSSQVTLCAVRRVWTGEMFV